MARIEPIPLEEMAPEPRRIIEEGVADGTYATPIPLQIFAYKTAQIVMTSMARSAFGKNTLLGSAYPRAHPDPQCPTGRMPAVHAVAQARLHHG